MADVDLPDALRDGLREAWHRYLDLLIPLRPALHGYCRRLTRNLWDAEDLVQDTLMRAFGTLGSLHQEVRNPKAYLFRTATNLWIDTLRRRGSEEKALAESDAPAAPPAPAPGAVRDAGSALLQRLAPRERAAVVLKDVFDFSLEDCAMVLETTVGAVKAALHRGRERLREPEGEVASRRPRPSAALVDRFVELFNAEDQPGLLELVLDNASVENVGCGVQYGREAHRSSTSWFAKALDGHPEWPAEWHYEARRAEARVFRGEPLVLFLVTRRGREAVEIAVRLEEEDGRVSRMRSYGFCPETMREIGEELGVPVRTGIYRYPTPAPGTNYTLDG